MNPQPTPALTSVAAAGEQAAAVTDENHLDVPPPETPQVENGIPQPPSLDPPAEENPEENANDFTVAGMEGGSPDKDKSEEVYDPNSIVQDLAEEEGNKHLLKHARYMREKGALLGKKVEVSTKSYKQVWTVVSDLPGDKESKEEHGLWSEEGLQRN